MGTCVELALWSVLAEFRGCERHPRQFRGPVGRVVADKDDPLLVRRERDEVVRVDLQWCFDDPIGRYSVMRPFWWAKGT